MNQPEQSIINEMSRQMSKIWVEGIADGSIHVSYADPEMDVIGKAFQQASRELEQERGARTGETQAG